MGAFDGVDAVDLNKTQTAYQIGQRLARGGARRRLCQRVAVQEQTAGLGVGKDHGVRLAAGMLCAKSVRR